MIESLIIEFGFEQSIASESLHSLLTDLRTQTAQIADGELSSLLYSGPETEYVPEELSPDTAIEHIVKHKKGFTQYQYENFFYSLQVNPTGDQPLAENNIYEERILINIDSVYFKSDYNVSASDVVDLVSKITSEVAPTVLIGYGIDIGPENPLPELKWITGPKNDQIPIHWLTYLPADLSGEGIFNEMHTQVHLNDHVLGTLTPSPTDIADIRQKQQLLADLLETA